MSGARRISVSLSAAATLAAFDILATSQIASAAPIACTTPALMTAIAGVAGRGSVTLASYDESWRRTGSSS